MTTLGALSHRLERTVAIQARREAVFGFFTDAARWASWWGAGSTIDARPGGQVVIRYPDATEAWGEVTEIVVPERIAFTYGYANGHLIPPGGSLVTIRLEAEGSHTRLHLLHAFADAVVRDQHVQGWRYQLSLVRQRGGRRSVRRGKRYGGRLVRGVVGACHGRSRSDTGPGRGHQTCGSETASA